VADLSTAQAPASQSGSRIGSPGHCSPSASTVLVRLGGHLRSGPFREPRSGSSPLGPSSESPPVHSGPDRSPENETPPTLVIEGQMTSVTVFLPHLWEPTVARRSETHHLSSSDGIQGSVTERLSPVNVSCRSGEGSVPADTLCGALLTVRVQPCPGMTPPESCPFHREHPESPVLACHLSCRQGCPKRALDL